MKRGNFILFLLFFISGLFYYFYVYGAFTGNSINNFVEVNVTRIVDGDTVELVNLEKVRLLGINTPEKGVLYADQAVNFTKQLLNQNVSLETKEKDKYGRNLGYIFYQGNLFNEEILRNGLAHFYSYEKDIYSERLLNAEKFARENNLGIWNKSPYFGCLEIVEFNYLDSTKEEYEKLVLENSCDIALKVLIKDEATHMYRETIAANSKYEKQTQNIWNDNGDTLFVWDDKGLLIFERYS